MTDYLHSDKLVSAGQSLARITHWVKRYSPEHEVKIQGCGPWYRLSIKYQPKEYTDTFHDDSQCWTGDRPLREHPGLDPIPSSVRDLIPENRRSIRSMWGYEDEMIKSNSIFAGLTHRSIEVMATEEELANLAQRLSLRSHGYRPDNVKEYGR